MAKKIKIGEIEFRKDVGHDNEHNAKFRVLSTDLGNGYKVVFKTFNHNVFIGDKSIRVVVSTLNEHNSIIGQMFLTQDQKPETFIDIVEQLKLDPYKLN